MSKKTYLAVLKTGIYLSLLSVFLVYTKFLFPFITSKQIYFNILIEILAIFWLVFILKYPEARPRKNYISFGLIGFFFVMLLSCFTGVDFNLSFWGDIERMLGVFHVVHFLLFYFILGSVMQSREDWRDLFRASIVCAIAVSIYGLLNKHYSTIGNTAYVSGYLIFNIYFAILLFFQERKSNLKWLYLLALPFMFLAFRKADTSGAYVGLGFSVLAAFFLYGILAKRKKIRVYTLSLFIILSIALGFIFANKNSEFVQKNKFIQNLTNQISFEKSTFQTRLISWRAALRDFPNHPILGTGHGNYAITFDKYFEPTFYNHTRTETYFDRAHNNLLDILLTTGMLGLVSYLAIFSALAFYLIKGYRQEKISLHEFVLISSLIIAYFIQNLAVFDSLVTYMMLMLTLGYVYQCSIFNEQCSTDNEKNKLSKNKEIYALVSIGFLMLLIIYQYNIKPIKMLIGTIDGQIAFARGNAEQAMQEYKNALSYNTGLDRDSHTSFINSINMRTDLLYKLDKQKAREIVDYAIFLAKKNVEHNPGDSLMQMQLAQTLSTAIGFYRDEPLKALNYFEQAKKAIDKSIEASPGRVRIYFTKAQIYLIAGEIENAIQTLKYASSLNEDYYDSFCHLAKVEINSGKIEQGYKSMDDCLAKGGKNLLAPASFVKELMEHYFQELNQAEGLNSGRVTTMPKTDLGKKAFENIIRLAERLSYLEPNNTNILVLLSGYYVLTGENEKAIQKARKAGEIDPNLASSAEEFILQIENK